MERKSLQNKRDYNLPISKNQKQINIISNTSSIRIINFAERFDISKQLRKSKADSGNAPRQIENSSRSNSIKGRKLSFCDAQLTVSQNTLETIGTCLYFVIKYLDRVPLNQRERETFQRLSAAGLAVNGIGNGFSSNIESNTTQNQQDQYKSFSMIPPFTSKTNRSPLKENQVKTQFNVYSNYNQKIKKQEQQKQTSKQQNQNQTKQPATSFLLTFNKDKSDSPRDNRKRSEEQLKTYGNNKSGHKNKENDKNVYLFNQQSNVFNNKMSSIDFDVELIPQHIQLQKNDSKDQQPIQRILKANIIKESRIKKLEQEGEKIKQHFLKQQNSSNKKRAKTSFDNRFSTPSTIVKDNLKKHGQKQKKVFQQILVQEVQKTIKQQQNKVKNQLIRERNQNPSQVKQKLKEQNKSVLIYQKPNQNAPLAIIKEQQSINQKQVNKTIDEGLKMKSKSPIKSFHQGRNKDMPLKVSNEQQQKKKKYDLGLEIFELKKEMGMYGEDKQQLSIEKILTERSKKKKIQKLKKELIKAQQEQNEVYINQKKHQENPQLQKLISKQFKKRIKQQKQEKILEIISHQKVMANLKTLNEQTESKRHHKRKEFQKENNQRGNNFKTVQDIDTSTNIIKGKDIINGQVSIPSQKEKDNRKSMLEQNNRSVSQKRQKAQSRIDKFSPPKNNQNNQVAINNRKKLKIKQSFVKEQNIPKSSRISLLDPVNKIQVQIPKTKIIYSYVSNDNQIAKSNKNLKQISPQKDVYNNQMKKSVSKQRLIKKIMKQLEKQKDSQESFRRQNQRSRSKSLNRKHSYKEKGQQADHRIISIDTPNLNSNRLHILNQKSQISKSSATTHRMQQLDSPHRTKQLDFIQNPERLVKQKTNQDVDTSAISDNVMIDDEMMIFCVLTTAASIIQRNFRNYLLKKNRRFILQNQLVQEYQQNVSLNQTNQEIFLSENQVLSESTKLENRFLPISALSNKNLNDLKKKTPKHTFSFGNYEDNNQSSNPQISVQNKTIEKQKSPDKKSVQKAKQQIEDKSFRLDSSLVEDSRPQFPPDSKDIYLSSFNQYKSSQEESKHISSQNNSSKDLDRLLNINDKFKYALRNLAEKQKQVNILDKFKAKNDKKPQRQAQISDLQLELEQIYQQNKLESNRVQRNQHFINESYGKHSQSQTHQEYLMESLQEQINMINGDNQNSQVELSKMSIEFEDESEDAIQSELQIPQQQDPQKAPVASISESQNAYQFQQKIDPQKHNNIIEVKRVLNDELRFNEDSQISSLLSSKGDQTDKIIKFSPINTNEELIEAAINESNSLNNEESLMINDSNIQSKVDETQKQISNSDQFDQKENQQQNISIQDISRHEIKIEDFVNYPIFGYKVKNESVLDNSKAEKLSKSERNSKIYNPIDDDEEEKFDIKQMQNLFSQQPTKTNMIEDKKPMLRMMFGDEKFLNNHDLDLQILSLEGTPREGSAPPTHRLMTENPYFLATNGSIFERNPFKEFTTNKLNEVLANKNYNEIAQLKEDALKYQEKLEKGYINRLERREELSPKSSQRRKYELERWVSSERKKVQEKVEDNRPINLFDLEQERREAAIIIDNVNKKAKDIKFQLQMKKLESPIHIQDQLQTYKKHIKIQPSQSSSSSGDDSSSQIDISIEEEMKETIKDQMKKSEEIPELELQKKINENLRVIESLNQQMDLTPKEKDRTYDFAKTSNQKDELPTAMLEISFEDDEDDFEEFKFLQEKNKEDAELLIRLGKLQQLKDEQNFISQQEDSVDHFSQQEKLTQQKIENADRVSEMIFTEFIHQETDVFLINFLMKQKDLIRYQAQEQLQRQEVSQFDISNYNSNQQEHQFQNQQSPQQHVSLRSVTVSEEDMPSQKQLNQQNSLSPQQYKDDSKIVQLQNEKYSQIVKPNPILEASLKELTHQSREQIKRLGIDTSIESIEQYINEIFSQITVRREQFLQAFITPIYKNPLEILANLQRPDYGDMEAGMDFTNSLAYILNVQLYLTLEKARENSISNDDELTDMISESQHIHNKVIFDSVNEALNQVRPYGNQGEPMPWSKKPRKNLMFMFDTTENLDQILYDVKTKVVSWSRTKAGALPPKYGGTIEFHSQTQQMDEEQFAHQREKCLAQLLAQDLIQQEEKWLDYEMEEAQVKIDLSDIILEHLIGETVDILNNVKNPRVSPTYSQ
ncbi:iq calmodulin-binding motif family protein [Stylonychia lemnae]|uniref:Iq calmodulin-binding motif family protein n=1 Tax=Stylonychia lemnae TaxID=5949 RepID=A0A078ANP1_STYLE|nr:iq calmodulin-binding motif family protein [Stylonychia lemnae]|eukprot:CDW82922.1 iq calmodulin-binding motif family protein [Stylonychia lemnae]